MADLGFRVVTQYPGLDTLGGTQTQEVVFVGVVTHGHGTYVEFPVAKSGYPDLVKAAALGWVTIAETLWTQPNVIGVQQAQTVNPSNQLVYSWIISVEGSGPESWSTVTIANNDLGPQLGLAQINKLHNDLVSIDGGAAALEAEG